MSTIFRQIFLIISSSSFIFIIYQKKYIYKTINKYHVTIMDTYLLLLVACYQQYQHRSTNPNLSKTRSQVESISKFPSTLLHEYFFCSTSFNRRTFSIIRDGTRSKFNSKRNKGDATGASRSVTQRSTGGLKCTI